ncbi:M20 family peptidase [Clostridium sp. DL1XJH146]
MRFLLFLLVVLVVLIVVVLVRTLKFKSKKFSVQAKGEFNIDRDKAVKNLADVIKIKTVSHSDYSETDWDKFKELHKRVEENYKLVHKKLSKTVVNEYSLVYKWKGKNSDKKPILLTAHMDVVPASEDSLKDWTYPPFSGELAEGHLWGRGTLDIKIQMIAVLEAVENLLAQNYEPDRDIYLAFGHDEEVGGSEGATNIVKYFEENNITFDFVIDEGGCVTEEALAGVDGPLAVIGIAEKGYSNVRLSVESTGGHASMPPKNTALGEIAKAIVALEKNQCETKITKPLEDMLMYIGPEMSFSNKMIISNLWLFAPVFKMAFAKTGAGNAQLRTTTAASMSSGSMEPNILPGKATATFNFRILPGETGQDLLEHIEKVVNNPRVKIEPLRLEDPSKVSSADSEGFKIIEKTVYQIFDEAIVSPYLVMAGTDARKYEDVSDNVYRFSPYQIHNDDLKRMHGVDERISFENIEKAVHFFMQMIVNSNT